MITRVEIQNFQSHKETALEFDLGTNVIIGPSDAGKSSIFRAINWVVSNRPLGDAYRSEWGGDTRVALHTTEGDVIERIRTATRNEYVVNGQVLKAFGTEVPEEITNALRLDGFSVQAQMDSPFLLAMTPGEAARTLNRAASIDDIDHTVAGLRRSHTKINRDVEYNRGQIRRQREELKPYEDLPTIEEKLEAAERLEAAREQNARNLTALKRATERGKDLVDRLSELTHVPVLLGKCKALIYTHDSLRQAAEDLSKFKRVAGRAADVLHLLQATEYVPQVEPLLARAEAEFTAQIQVEKKITNLKKRAIRALGLYEELMDQDEKIHETQDEYHELAPEFCPLCGGRME